MGEIVNLRRARKARDRTEREAAAARNRASFGRTRAEREASDAERLKSATALDRHRIELTGDEPSGDGPAG